jgi:hypothetical protein
MNRRFAAEKFSPAPAFQSPITTRQSPSLCLCGETLVLMFEQEVQQEQYGQDIRQDSNFLCFAGTDFHTDIG